MFSSENHSFRSCESMLLLFRSEEKGGGSLCFSFWQESMLDMPEPSISLYVERDEKISPAALPTSADWANRASKA